MIKKIIFLLALFTITVVLISCGGSGGGGSSSTPGGVNKGIASVIQLLPIQVIAQTNSYVYFHAKVLDGNGRPLKNTLVTFINVSTIGSFCNGVNQATTDGIGFATVCLTSPNSGFVTVQAEVYTGAGIVRARMTVYFTSADFVNLKPFLVFDVDAEADETWNEDTDFRLLETPSDDMVWVRVTLKSGTGLPVKDATVTFGADVPYRIGGDPNASCSDGTNMCEVSFPSGNVRKTDTLGQATVLLQVTPNILKIIQSLFNVTASTSIGASGMVTLFFDPVKVASIALSADPTIVPTEGTSDITATATTNLNAPVPDGTTIAFTTAPNDPLIDPVPCGSVTSFVQTTSGVADSTFTAPSLPGVCDVTGTLNELSDTVSIIVTSELMVLPSEQTVDPTGAAVVARFTVMGGAPGYTIVSNNVQFPPVLNFLNLSGDAFTVTVPADTPDDSVKYTILDTVGASVEATLTIAQGAASSLIIVPGSWAPDVVNGDTLAFTVSGGTHPYIITSTNPFSVYDSAPGDGVWNVDTSGSTFIANVPSGTCSGSVELNVFDAAADTTSATVTLGSGATLTVTPTSALICENNDACLLGLLETAAFTVAGGVAPYSGVSSNTLIIPNPGIPGGIMTIDAVDGSIPDGGFPTLLPTTVDITITDACGTALPAIPIGVIDD